VLLFVSAIADGASYILAKDHFATIPIINVYFLVSFSVLSFMYARLLHGAKQAILSFIGIGFACFLWDTFCIHTIVTMQSYTVTLFSVLAIGYTLVYYDHLLSTMPAMNITRFPFFWINTAVAYYFCFNLFLFVFSTYIFENLKEEEVLAVWIFHNLNNTIKNILFAVGLSHVSERNVYS